MDLFEYILETMNYNLYTEDYLYESIDIKKIGSNIKEYIVRFFKWLRKKVLDMIEKIKMKFRKKDSGQQSLKGMIAKHEADEKNIDDEISDNEVKDNTDDEISDNEVKDKTDETKKASLSRAQNIKSAYIKLNRELINIMKDIDKDKDITEEKVRSIESRLLKLKDESKQSKMFYLGIIPAKVKPLYDKKMRQIEDSIVKCSKIIRNLTTYEILAPDFTFYERVVKDAMGEVRELLISFSKGISVKDINVEYEYDSVKKSRTGFEDTRSDNRYRRKLEELFSDATEDIETTEPKPIRLKNDMSVDKYFKNVYDELSKNMDVIMKECTVLYERLEKTNASKKSDHDTKISSEDLAFLKKLMGQMSNFMVKVLSKLNSDIDNLKNKKDK
jgi:hypothetical protein